MDIRIGMMNTGRELNFAADETAEAISAKVGEALSAGTTLTLADAKGSTYIVPAAALAYIEIGSQDVRKVGFVA